MFRVRPAAREDREEVFSLLGELYLFTLLHIPDEFWIAEADEGIVGVAGLAKYKNVLFLSSIGVKEDYRRRGVAAAILREIFKAAQKDIYLYTIIPHFFERWGFVPAPFLDGLPPRNIFGCEGCTPECCVCMRKTIT